MTNDEMIRFRWYVRVSDKNENGTYYQYGVKTGIKEFDFSVFFKHPAHGKRQISTANFDSKGYYNKLISDGWDDRVDDKMQHYLWTLVENELGRNSIKRLFRDFSDDSIFDLV